jgi:DNA repair photolyase
VVTKGFLVVRDADVLARLDDAAGAAVQVSIPFADAAACKAVEPQAPPPSRRFEMIRRLHEAGVPVGVMVSPIIPGLNDHDIPTILEQAADAGAGSATFTALRLPPSVEEVFVARLHEAMPLRVKRVLSRLRDIRGGELNDSQFGERMRGRGVYWEAITRLFEISAKRLGLWLNQPCARTEPSPPRKPPGDAQLSFEFLAADPAGARPRGC